MLKKSKTYFPFLKIPFIPLDSIDVSVQNYPNLLGTASVFLVLPTTRGRSGGSVSHLHGGHASTSVDAAAFSGGPSRARAHRRCAPGFSGCIPAALGFLLRRVPNLHVQRQTQLSAEYGDRRRHPRALVNAAVVRQHDKRQHEVPLMRVPMDHGGQHIEERSVDLSACPLRCGWYGEDRVFLMQNRRLISIPTDASNERPGSLCR
ncbi:hypothetical protein T07_14454 [Trichinella nelsoni]|uniref:Uncharacterized protein n=1 Tax=Trichinella nelsoni TaxID=6336 RepID=A0A0V0SF08_9BILA|nr:hypothetical protein T07_14454 [Trichinella nelsoni]